MSKVQLTAVDQSNYERICDLEVFEEQEDYVASNLWSLVQASYNPTCSARAIYHGDEPVGLFLWSAESPGKVSIWRFMVDKQHQNRGIGRQALGLLLEELQQIQGLAQIEICYHPRNPIAGNFYSSFGFVETGMDEDGDDMLAVIDLPQPAAGIA
ncbi:MULTISPECIES: GNAT family N-acetyltransferase [Pseudomonas]|uniref:GNAT family N-acetyltransferase n=1 Tax=Pseudomonas piscis TaxID=2614538 RepID=A0ABY9N901_9PSED|nr:MULTISPECIES: GNAT family N-acetyltransferase [Pseudomonas]POA54802.1 GNAT family N-acetyltransferase [Pseudomonas sp. FW507-12TSA]WMN14869.1 GNAT family N-acetyltransferase [Pseudomonas piscis]